MDEMPLSNNNYPKREVKFSEIKGKREIAGFFIKKWYKGNQGRIIPFAIKFTGTQAQKRTFETES